MARSAVAARRVANVSRGPDGYGNLERALPPVRVRGSGPGPQLRCACRGDQPDRRVRRGSFPQSAQMPTARAFEPAASAMRFGVTTLPRVAFGTWTLGPGRDHLRI